MNMNLRDKFICQDYEAGEEVSSLSRSYGLSERRIAQILEGNGVERRPRYSHSKKSALSAKHALIGKRLYDYRFDNNIELQRASEDLGWGVIKLRKIENGVTNLELLDLLDISAYTGKTIEQLLEI